MENKAVLRDLDNLRELQRKRGLETLEVQLQQKAFKDEANRFLDEAREDYVNRKQVELEVTENEQKLRLWKTQKQQEVYKAIND